MSSITTSSTMWLGDPSLPPERRGLRVLGLPLGPDACVQAELVTLRQKQQPLLDALPAIPDLQTSWLLLLYCASPRAHYALRGLRPDLTRDYATAHDLHIQRCLGQLLQLPEATLPEASANRARLALTHGGLGLRSAFHHTAAAFWASWQDAARTIHSKTPEVFQLVARQLQSGAPPSQTLQCLQHVERFLTNIGFTPPAWPEAAPAPAAAQPPDEPRNLLRGWQKAASATIDQGFHAATLPTLDPASQALLESQQGPFAATVFTMLPTSPDLVLDAAQFRVLLLRQLRLPLPHTPAL